MHIKPDSPHNRMYFRHPQSDGMRLLLELLSTNDFRCHWKVPRGSIITIAQKSRTLDFTKPVDFQIDGFPSTACQTVTGRDQEFIEDGNAGLQTGPRQCLDRWDRVSDLCLCYTGFSDTLIWYLQRTLDFCESDITAMYCCPLNDKKHCTIKWISQSYNFLGLEDIPRFLTCYGLWVGGKYWRISLRFQKR